MGESRASDEIYDKRGVLETSNNVIIYFETSGIPGHQIR